MFVAVKILKALKESGELISRNTVCENAQRAGTLGCVPGDGPTACTHGQDKLDFVGYYFF